jgi:hypothetical protein
VYTSPTSGDSVVLVADQVLWFGNDVHFSLIKPHQIRAHGYGVCDDPWDPHLPIGIELESLFVPLTVSGPNLLLESHVLTDWELSNLPIIEITSSIWNPADMHMSAPRSTTTRVVDSISTAMRDIWHPSTMVKFLDSHRGEWKKRVRKYSINPKYSTEPYSPFRNKAELNIWEL